MKNLDYTFLKEKSLADLGNYAFRLGYLFDHYDSFVDLYKFSEKKNKLAELNVRTSSGVLYLRLEHVERFLVHE